MKALIYILGWGSPIGIGLFILLLSISAGIIIKNSLQSFESETGSICIILFIVSLG